MSAQAQTLKHQLNPVLDITNYWQHYGLIQDPFAITGDDGIYYAPERWTEYLDLLNYLCHYNNVLLAVTACVGSGKSTLKKKLAAKLKDNFSVCELQANSALNAAQLLILTGDAFSLSWDTECSEEEQLDAQLQQLSESDTPSVLIIDDAHLLPAETQRSLLHWVNRQNEDNMKLHIVLCGEPQLQSSLMRICQACGYENLVHALFLSPLSLEETGQYLQFRLNATGLVGEYPLSQQTVARIAKLSEGIPGRINRIARRTLLNALARQQDAKPAGFLSVHRTKLMGGVLLMAVLGSVILGLDWVNEKGLHFSLPNSVSDISLSHGDAASEKPATVKTLALETSPADGHVVTYGATPAETDPNADMAPKLAAALEMESARIAATDPQAALPAAKPSIAENTSAVLIDAEVGSEKPVIDQGQPATLQLKSPAPTAAPSISAVTPAVVNKAPVAITPAVSVPAQPVAVAPTTDAIATKPVAAPSAAPLATLTPPTIQQGSAAIATSATQVESVPASPAIIASQEARLMSAAEPKSSLSSKKSVHHRHATSSKRLPVLVAERSFGKNYYVLQLMGLSTQAAADRYLAEHQVKGLRLVRTHLQGKNWYVIVYGQYKTSQAAQTAVQHLPESLQALKPWPRTFASIHATAHVPS